MQTLRTLSSLVTALLLSAAPGDRPARPGRVVAGLAAPPAAASPRVPDFALFGWVSPPVESTTAARIAEMANMGLTLALPTYVDTATIAGRVSDNLARLDLVAAQGMQALIYDDRFQAYFTLDPRSPAGIAHLDSILADYQGRDAQIGWYMGDEPADSEFTRLAAVNAALRARDPGRFMWNNLRGRSQFATREDWLAYLRDYVARVEPTVLCDDEYDFLTDGDRGEFVENAAGLAAVARQSGLPFWCIVLDIKHLVYRQVTPGILAWQTSMLLAYGARGIGYFTYWTPMPSSQVTWGPGLIAYDGTHGPLYATAAALGPRLRAAGATLAHLTWLATAHAGSCPAGGTPFAPDDWVAAVDGRAALGEFADAAGGTRYTLVVNADSASAQPIALTLPHATQVDTLGAEPGAWGPLPLGRGAGGATVSLTLEPGAFALLRVTGDFGALRAGAGPALRAWPSPASALARIAYQGLGPGGRVEVLDASGRRVWSAAPPPGNGLLTWDGARERGGVAPPGVYFVRFEDARGVAAARLVWLGR